MLLRVVDIETTGMDPAEGAEIIELGWQDVADRHGGWDLTEGRGAILFDSERPSPPEVLAVHHILPRDLRDRHRFNIELGQAYLDGCGQGPADAYVAHNAKFEIAFLGGLQPARWLCTHKAALRVWPHAPAHNNQTLLYWLGLHVDLDEERRHPPHRAGPDAYVTAAILTRLLREVTVSEMIAWTAEPPLMPTCPIGKFRGKPWAEVEWGFMDWMLRQADMDPDLKWNARREMDRRRAEQRSSANG